MDNHALLTGEAQIPVFLLTGFLGSGKTTLLTRLLREPGLRRSAVLVNEFGDIGIDQLTIQRVSDEVRLLEHGCLCCTTREDLVDSLRELYVGRLDGTLSPFDRIIIETSGAADPVPAVHTLLLDPLLQSRFRYAGTITTIDTTQTPAALAAYAEGARQIALADCFVLTRGEQAGPALARQWREDLERANPDAAMLGDGPREVAGLATRIAAAALVRPQETAAAPPAPALAAPFAGPGPRPRLLPADEPRTAGGRYQPITHRPSPILSFVLRTAAPLPWPLLSDWLQTLIQRNRQTLLRIKGIVDVADHPELLLVQAVRHMFQPTMPALTRDPEQPGSRIVIIIDNATRKQRADAARDLLGPALYEAVLEGRSATRADLEAALTLAGANPT